MPPPALPMMSSMEEETEEFSFPAPSGFALPDTAQEGDLFDAVVKVKMKDGKIILDSINGSKLAGEPEEGEEYEEEETEEEPETDDSLEGAMAASGIMV